MSQLRRKPVNHLWLMLSLRKTEFRANIIVPLCIFLYLLSYEFSTLAECKINFNLSTQFWTYYLWLSVIWKLLSIRKLDRNKLSRAKVRPNFFWLNMIIFPEVVGLSKYNLMVLIFTRDHWITLSHSNKQFSCCCYKFLRLLRPSCIHFKQRNWLRVFWSVFCDESYLNDT